MSMSISGKLERAIKNLDSRLPRTKIGGWNYQNDVPAWRRCFEIIQPMHGASHKFDVIANIMDVEQLRDILAEVKFAVIFAHLGFQVELEPFENNSLASPNPDMRIMRDGESSIVEIKRFRQPDVYSPGQRLQRLPDNISELHTFPSYGHPAKDMQKIFTEIEKKFKQAGTDGIIAIWNSNDELSPPEVEAAVYSIRQKPGNSQKSCFVVLRGDPDERFSCFKLRNRLQLHQEEWMNEFTQVFPDNILRRVSVEATGRTASE